MSDAAAQRAVRQVLTRIDAAWRTKQFDGFDRCFADDAVIVGPHYQPYAIGRKACADSYREFATNAAILEYEESDHQLRLWPDTAVYTFAWQMTYARDGGPKRDAGTDQLFLGRFGDDWRVLFRYIHFAPTT